MNLQSYLECAAGSDIVDLRAANPPDAARFYARFVERVCTPWERDWLAAYAGDSIRRRHRALWSLWAAKEAVFKTRYSQAMLRDAASSAGAAAGFRRSHPLLDFTPQQIEISPDARITAARVSLAGAIFSGDSEFTIRYRHGAGWVHALCHHLRVPPPSVWIARRQQGPVNESEAVREMVLAGVGRRLSPLSQAMLSIHGGRATGCAPWLRYRYRRIARRDSTRRRRCFRGENQRMPISLSHDGAWLAGAVPVAFAQMSGESA
ncbi:MAG: 4'-phosphopantetheinyl transferase superfamily protein [bacterium]|nr:4'-phosphopantetheinyl transferase superfamily protein [bacterium]